jgi:hypothetical protein
LTYALVAAVRKRTERWCTFPAISRSVGLSAHEGLDIVLEKRAIVHGFGTIRGEGPLFQDLDKVYQSWDGNGFEVFPFKAEASSCDLCEYRVGFCMQVMLTTVVHEGRQLFAIDNWNLFFR